MAGRIQRRGIVELATAESGRCEECAASSEVVDGGYWYVESFHRATEAEKLEEIGANRERVVAIPPGLMAGESDGS